MTRGLTWEDTIKLIRNDNRYKQLVSEAYLDEDLKLNINRYRESDEFKEVLKLLKLHSNGGLKLLDVGAGNGISSIALSLEGYEVIALEPDDSETVGVGAIKRLKEIFQLDNVEVIQGYAESMNFCDNTFDIVFSRQCMHHANNLNSFVAEMGRVLKKGGVFMTIRDHVIYDEYDKKFFLNSHPLHKYYGGENAFRSIDYIRSIKDARLTLVHVFNYYDSVINYAPLPVEEVLSLKEKLIKEAKPFKLFLSGGKYRYLKRALSILERNIPGRMYSYIAYK